MSDILDRRYTFKANMLCTGDQDDDSLEGLYRYYSNPAPGITPMEGVVITNHRIDEEEDVAYYDIEMTVHQWLKEGVEFGVDPLDLLSKLKEEVKDPEVVQAAAEFLKDPNNGLSKAVLHMSQASIDELESIESPIKPEQLAEVLKRAGGITGYQVPAKTHEDM